MPKMSIFLNLPDRHTLRCFCIASLMVLPIFSEGAQNIVANPGFESNDGWELYTFAQAKSREFADNAHKVGNKSAHIGGVTGTDGVGWSQRVKVKPGVDYQFSIWVKSENGNAKIRVRGIDPRRKGNDFFKTLTAFLADYPVRATTDSWIRISKTFNSGIYETVDITIYAFAMTGDVWFDGVELYPVSQDTAYGIKQGDFETEGEWNFVSYSKNDIKGYFDAKAGYRNGCTVIEGNGSGLWNQTVSVKRSTGYQLSVMYRGEVEDGYAYLKVLGGAEKMVLAEERFRGRTAWLPIKMNIFTGEFTEIRVDLILIGKGRAFFDDVFLTPNK